MRINHKLQWARQNIRDHGLLGYIRWYARRKWQGRHALTAVLREVGVFGLPGWYYAHGDTTLPGWLVERRGNVVTLDHMTFDVGVPNLSRRQKTGMARGEYEREERAAVRQYLDPALPVIELGGFIGVVSCAINRRLDQPAQHVVVEANPDNLPVLEGNRARNHARFTILNRAIAYDVDTVLFHRAGLAGRVVPSATADTVEVATTTVQHIAADAGFERFALVADIEGNEVDLVQHEIDLLATRVPLIIMELHPAFTGRDRTDAITARLLDAGFKSVAQLPDAQAGLYVAVFRNQTFA